MCCDTSGGSQWTGLAGFGGAARHRRLRREFDILHDPPEVLDIWLDLVVASNLKGKRIHDAHLLATMKANRVSTLLTFNASDFPAASGFSILNPES